MSDVEDYAAIEDAVAAFGRGEFLVVQDDDDRENEGDLILAADFATPEKIAFMVRHTSGVICMPMTAERLQELRLPQMVDVNTESHATAFTISVDYKVGTDTGISAADRSATIRALVDPKVRAEDFCRPGHIFPLRARQGGVLKRAGHTEAAVDLARMAGLNQAGAICELVSEDGSMMRGEELRGFAKEHKLLHITIADLIRYRRKHEKLVRKVSEARLPTEYGTFTAYVYESLLDGIQHLAMVMGDPKEHESFLVRVHSECLTGDIFHSTRCDCGTQLDQAFRRIAEQGAGALIYLRGHEGRGIGIAHKLRAYQLQDAGRDTVDANLELGLPADSREYGIGAQMLVDLGVSKLRLLTNNPSKYGGLEGFDLEIVERVPIICTPTEENRAYLETKQARMGHLLGI